VGDKPAAAAISQSVITFENCYKGKCPSGGLAK
jgi:hypothetical protein